MLRDCPEGLDFLLYTTHVATIECEIWPFFEKCFVFRGKVPKKFQLKKSPYDGEAIKKILTVVEMSINFRHSFREKIKLLQYHNFHFFYIFKMFSAYTFAVVNLKGIVLRTLPSRCLSRPGLFLIVNG